MKRLTARQLRSLVESVIKEDVEWISRLSLAHEVSAVAKRLVNATRAKDAAAFDEAIDSLKTEINF